jgi:general secretion pathway protein G
MRTELSAQREARTDLEENRDPLCCARSPIRIRRSRERGITLIEMLVVVTIIALFASVVGISVFKYLDDSKRKAARVQISNFRQVLLLYKNSTGTFPSNGEGLNALRVKPENSERWDGPYLDGDVPLDPWGHPYLYKFPGDHGDEPDIVSLGADGQPGGEGNNADIVSWNSK